MSSVCVALGIIILLSGVIINPWAGKLYRVDMINYQDVMWTYFVWAVVIGLVVVGSGLIFRMTTSGKIQNVAILVVTCLLIVLSDRLLLARLGLPLWMPDLDNHYKHRPNTVRSWGSSFNDKLIRINQYGHHDRDFPLHKGKNEFRGLMIGDSVTMGHGMTYEETFSNQLENILREKVGSRRNYRIINAGVQGYSTFQEYNTLRRSLVFKPDFIAIGFCMNDPTEPFVVDERFGGVGLDYHGITQASSMLISYTSNETGYGRWLQRLQERKKSKELTKKWEVYSVKEMARSRVDDPRFAENWKMVLLYLNKMYDVTRSENIRVALLIFPHTFQLMNDELKEPQHILIEHARARNIDVIDLTDVFEREIFNRGIVKLLKENEFSNDEIHGLYRDRIRKYFLDEDHFTVEGHKSVASRLFGYVSSHYSF
jgi:lysophospholipase L1-like esterase